MELSSSSTTQSGHHLRTVQTTAEGTPFSGSMNNMALCDFDMRRLRRTLTYLLTYLLTAALVHFVHRVTEMLEHNAYVRCLMIDFCKESDSVAMLFLCLKFCGLTYLVLWLTGSFLFWPIQVSSVKQEGQHPLTGQRTANFRLLANQ